MNHRLAFCSPTEVRLWMRVTGYTIDAMPMAGGESTSVRNFGEKVGTLILEPDGDGDYCGVVYWDKED